MLVSEQAAPRLQVDRRSIEGVRRDAPLACGSLRASAQRIGVDGSPRQVRRTPGPFGAWAGDERSPLLDSRLAREQLEAQVLGGGKRNIGYGHGFVRRTACRFDLHGAHAEDALEQLGAVVHRLDAHIGHMHVAFRDNSRIQVELPRPERVPQAFVREHMIELNHAEYDEEQQDRGTEAYEGRAGKTARSHIAQQRCKPLPARDGDDGAESHGADERP